MDATALLYVSYLDQLVPREALSDTVTAFTTHLAGLSPLSLQITKKALNGMCRGDLDSAWLKHETVACFATEDAAEGLAAAREKRTPVFKGR